MESQAKELQSRLDFILKSATLTALLREKYATDAGLIKTGIAAGQIKPQAVKHIIKITNSAGYQADIPAETKITEKQAQIDHLQRTGLQLTQKAHTQGLQINLQITAPPTTDFHSYIKINGKGMLTESYDEAYAYLQGIGVMLDNTEVARMRKLLKKCHEFIAGFEDDEAQQGLDKLLSSLEKFA